MTLAEKLKYIRDKSELSQNELAEKLNVSRSAIAKWESGNGMPDIDNLKLISELFHISLDDLLTDEKDSNFTNDNEDIKAQIKKEIFHSYVGVKCDVQLDAWNDGVNDAYVLSYDKHFLYYCINDKHPSVGALGIKYIESIEKCRKKVSEKFDLLPFEHINRNYFLGKTANVYLNEKHFWSGLIGEETEYLEIVILEVNDTNLCILKGACNEQEIPIEKIAQIEIL